MRYSITQSQIQYFKDHSFITFEQLLTNKQIDIIKTHCLARVLTKPFVEAYKQTRDNFRKDSALSKIITNNHLASIAATLINKRSLRIGLDQLLISLPQNEDIEALPKMFQGRYNSEQLFCLQGIACGLLINIDAHDPHPNYPQEPGGGVFFSPKWPIDFHELLEAPNQSYLLILYTNKHALYVDQPLDICRHQLKEYGYGFGDPLKHEFHPMLYF